MTEHVVSVVLDDIPITITVEVDWAMDHEPGSGRPYQFVDSFEVIDVDPPGALDGHGETLKDAVWSLIENRIEPPDGGRP